MPKQTATTQDLYESAYLLTRGARIDSVESFYENGRLVCRFTFIGDEIQKAQQAYYNGQAEVNLWEFRRCFSRINALVGNARKEARLRDVSEPEVLR
jgi:hypothetical protein